MLKVSASNVIGFSRVNLAQFTKALSFGYFLKDFYPLHELGTKGMTSQMVEGPWSRIGRFRAFKVSMHGLSGTLSGPEKVSP